MQPIRPTVSTPTPTPIQPPLQPQIPIQILQSLIPRLTSTINDIDSFRSLLEHGAQDNTMPNWDIILQRYGMLLGRLSSLQQYISLPSSTSSKYVPSKIDHPLSQKEETKLKTEGYFLHPLQPLPKTSLDALTAETFFMVLSTQPIIPSTFSQTHNPEADDPTRDVGIERLGEKKKEEVRRAELRNMGRRDLDGVLEDLKRREMRSKQRVLAVLEEIDKRAEDVDWGLRIRPEEDEDEDHGDKNEDKDKNGQDVIMVDFDTPKEKEEGKQRWNLNDYVRYLDFGVLPIV
ncbi:hypothetical protein M231_00667 [Tremella mesenterica]|uniref:Mediator of RNA polymerase II transcription subunit 8 n=1 Tax=Tremella mesenterica TaxID=5217 RepID=A0A4Q1BVA3_TREME|nr:hypothetical protein M231_00667 [Tremella mesenterica]